MTDEQLEKAIKCWTGTTVSEKECMACPYNDKCTLEEIANEIIHRWRECKTENATLRERLEKAVELPCKLYDKVWDKNRSEFEILEIRVTGTNFYIYCGNKTTGETVYFDGEDIGDEWFTTEEACDLHRRAFGLDKPKNESDEVRLAELKGEER